MCRTTATPTAMRNDHGGPQELPCEMIPYRSAKNYSLPVTDDLLAVRFRRKNLARAHEQPADQLLPS
jgi:hypothetical protein